MVNATYVLNTAVTKDYAIIMISDAESAVSRAQSEGRSVGLDESKTLLNQANQAYSAGNYAEAFSLASQAKAKADAATSPLQPVLPLALMIVAGAASLAAYALLRKRSLPAAPAYVKERHAVDMERIVAEGNLRQEDLEVMQFLAESGGENFESEIRNRFKLPRTTIWRTVKRLERDGYITVSTVAGQNLVKVRPEYLKRMQDSG